MKMFIWLNCLVLAMIFFASEGIERSWCPISCNCRGTIKAANLSCLEGFWNRLPTVYKNVHLSPTVIQIFVKNGNFGKLEKPENCPMYNKLNSLQLLNNMISTVAKDAFSCMPDLEHLILTHSEVEEFWPGTFTGLQKLTFLSLADNKLTPKVFTDICKMKKLRDLWISNQKMKINYRNLKCLENMEALRLIDISHNTFLPPVQHVLQIFRHVSYLAASSCNISNLNNDSFSGFANITTLFLDNNSLRNIAKFTFANLTNLETITLHGNIITNNDWLNFTLRLKNVGLSNLKDIPKLPKTLLEAQLHNNNFSSIPTGSFVGMPRLGILDLRNSHIYQIEESAFQDLPQLDLINLKQNYIGADSIKNLFVSFANTSLHKAYFESCNLPHVDGGLFQYFRSNELKQLHFIKCNIRKIDPLAFDNLSELLELHITNNYITIIYPNTFCEMTKLELLDLSNNQISELDHNAFHGLNNLKKLFLNNNHLTTFDGELVGLCSSSLRSLLLGNNNINRLSPLSLTNLQTLALSGNKLTNLKTNMFNATKQLQTLILSKNKFQSIKSDVFAPLQKLKVLVLSGNNIPARFIFEGGVRFMKDLSDLDISYNKVSRPRSINITYYMKYLSSLENVKMSNCGLTELQPGMFSLFKLDFLNCNHNDISFIEPTAFKGAKNLREMLLIGNKIRYIDHNSFQYLPNLRELHLSNNPLVCSCEVLWMVQAFKTELIFIGSSGLSSLRCDAPPELRGATVESIHLRLTDCEQAWIKMLWPMVGSLASLIAVAFVLILWKYRWNMKYLVYLVTTGRRRYREMKDDQDYEYDAFIAYSEHDLEWVTKEMLPHIDKDYLGEDGFKLCIHERDWLVGVDIVANIVSSIDTSRRTILVLSNAFAASKWCQYELAIAQLKLDADGTSRDLLIIILLNDIDANLLTPRLRCILASKTYLPWSNDVDKQHLFWKVLIKSLKKPIPVRP